MAAHDYETSDWLGSRVELFLFETDDAQYRWAYTTDSKPKLFGVTTPGFGVLTFAAFDGGTA